MGRMSLLPWLKRLSRRPAPGEWLVHTDGAICPERGLSGLAAIARDESGQIRRWWRQQAGRMTNNEAEYAAAILALENLLVLGIRRVNVYTDSRVLVEQMQGLACVRSANLRQPYARLRELVHHFEQVNFYHIRRDQNQLADALAFEALQGGYLP